MNCEELGISLEAFGTPDALNAEAREHLRECSACAEYVARFGRSGVLLQQALSQPPAQASWLKVKAGLASRLNAERAVLRRRHWWRWAAAAVIIFSVCGVLTSRLLAPGTPPAALGSQIAHLQDKVKQDGVLEELQQLQVAFEESGRTDAKALAEDAELYVERIMLLSAADAEQSREILAGIRAAQIADKLRNVKKQVDARDLTAAAGLDLVAATLDEAGRIAEQQGGANAD